VSVVRHLFGGWPPPHGWGFGWGGEGGLSYGLFFVVCCFLGCVGRCGEVVTGEVGSLCRKSKMAGRILLAKRGVVRGFE